MLGYLCHLLLDRYFLTNFVSINIKEWNINNIFTADKMYKDYTTMNALLINFFQLDINYINKLLEIDNFNLDKDKYNKNVECINTLETDGNLGYINFDLYTKFLIDISEVISKEISKIMK